MPPDRKQERQQIQLLLDALAVLPNVEALTANWHVREDKPWSDAQLTFTVGDTRRVILQVEAKSRSLFPRDVREILWSLKGDKRFELPASATPLLQAYSLSNGAKEALRSSNVGYFDSGGSLFISAPGFYVLIDRPEPKPIEKKNRSMFRGKRAQVMHAMLQRHGQWVSVKDIAQEADVSPATASEAMSMLDLFDWMSSRGNGPSKERCLEKPGSLLDAWVTQLKSIRPPSYRRYYVPRKDPESIARDIAIEADNLKMTYALTGEFAAQHYMPYLTTISTLRCKVRPGRAEELAQMVSAQPVDEGANLLILESRDDGDFLFTKVTDDLCLASSVMVYLDLIRSPGRAAEMADHLRREVLGY